MDGVECWRNTVHGNDNKVGLDNRGERSMTDTTVVHRTKYGITFTTRVGIIVVDIKGIKVLHRFKMKKVSSCRKFEIVSTFKRS